MAASTASAHTSLRAFQAEIDKVKNDAQKARHEHEQRVAAEQLASHHGQKKNIQGDKSKAGSALGKDTAKKTVAEPPVSNEGHSHVEQDQSIAVCSALCHIDLNR